MGNSASGDNKEFGKKTSSDELAEKFGENASGKFVIITGGNSGLGMDCARVLALKGSNVIIACRSEQKGAEAVAELKKLQPDGSVEFMKLDLGSFSSIRKFASDYKASKKPLHILLNNAGVMACPLTLTAEGLEMQFGTNHIGHFLLTNELMDVIKSSGTREQPSRIINLSSVGQYYFAPSMGVRLDDLKAESSYDIWERYGSSKLANILFTKQLQKNFTAEKAAVVAVSVHPGVINETNLARYLDLPSVINITSKIAPLGLGAMYSFFLGDTKNIKQGAATSVYCALCPEVASQSGAHFADCAVDTVFLHPKALDAELAEALWKASEKIVAK